MQNQIWQHLWDRYSVCYSFNIIYKFQRVFLYGFYRNTLFSLWFSSFPTLTICVVAAMFIGLTVLACEKTTGTDLSSQPKTLTINNTTIWQIFISSVTMILHQMKSCHLWRPVLLLPFLWMTLQTSQWSQILQIKFCRKQSAYVVLSNDKYAGNFHNANCLHIIHKGTLSKLNCKCPFFFLFTDQKLTIS